MDLPEWWPSDKPWIIGDCLEGMKGLPDNVIDLTVTSPPYDDLRTYGNIRKWGFSKFKPIAEELYRITKKGGVVVWVVGDETIKFCETSSSFKQALHFKTVGFNLLDTMIYLKDNYVPGYPTLRRYSNQFEYMFVLCKVKPSVFNPIQVKKVRNKIEKGCKMRKRDGKLTDSKLIIPKKDTKDASNVWHYPTAKSKYAGNHPAVFPDALAKDHILSWSNKGGIVLDPFLGSGTVIEIAKSLNRIGLGFEINPDYEDIIRKRTREDHRPLEDYFDQGYVPEKKEGEQE